MIHRIGAVVLALALSAPALASQCPADMAKVDAALAANRSLDQNMVVAVKALCDAGERLHNSGRHSDAVATLRGAKKMLRNLGIEVR